MISPFQERVRVALGDRNLHVALDRATAQLGGRQSMALSTLENSDLVRDVARRAKMEILRDLGGNLKRFEGQLLANGAQVHWAEDGRQANRIILEIAKRRGLKRVVKGKSMATEETHLNAALAKAGLEVVETDLGEYIVQLADSRPSHIILPIAHMTREDVGRLMEQRIGVPYSDDPRTLAGYAREKLRDAFLRADLGITGANFGVVQTGTICLVTNEGNGRMVTTLPKVHVVVMGIEKLVPTMADLDLFLKILARSATGQKLTAYTTLIRGPKKPDEESGPEELHVVLLDNGRSSGRRDGPDKENRTDTLQRGVERLRHAEIARHDLDRWRQPGFRGSARERTHRHVRGQQLGDHLAPDPASGCNHEDGLHICACHPLLNSRSLPSA